MNYFKKILKYATPYKGFALLNIFFNSLYALFSALSMVAFIPLLEVLFQNTKKVLIKPIYNESGKVMKGPNYFKPNLSKFVS